MKHTHTKWKQSWLLFHLGQWWSLMISHAGLVAVSVPLDPTQAAAEWGWIRSWSEHNWPKITSRSERCPPLQKTQFERLVVISPCEHEAFCIIVSYVTCGTVTEQKEKSTQWDLPVLILMRKWGWRRTSGGKSQCCALCGGSHTCTWYADAFCYHSLK